MAKSTRSPAKRPAADAPTVLMLSAYFEGHTGGIEIVAGRLVRELSALGRHVIWAAADTHEPPRGLNAVPLNALNATERFGVPMPVPSIGALRKLKQLVDEADAVVLHDVIYPAHLAAILFAQWSGTPYLVIQHIGTVPYRNVFLRGLMRLADRMLTRPLLARAEQTVFISEITAQHFEGVAYRRKPKIVHNGVDTDIFKPAKSVAQRRTLRRQLGVKDTDRLALFVGRFVEKKGLHSLEQLARQRPDLTFVLAGWGAIDPAAWGLPNVRVVNGKSRKALAALYQASDVFVLPSVGEGYPLVIQEALACGLPVICGADTAEADRKAKPLLRAVSIDTHDPAVTASRVSAEIDAALKGPKSVGRARAKFAAARYEWRRIATVYDALIGRLLTQRKRPAAARRMASRPRAA
jgi:glycosyltransferase involved in cell wall biosynthesis